MGDGCMTPKKRRETPDGLGAEAPGISDSLEPAPRELPQFDASPAGVLLKNFVAAMNVMGDDAEEGYQVALRELRQRRGEVLVELARAEDRADPQDYSTRWALVHIASELRHSAALSHLTNLVSTPIPPEQSTNPHSYSTVVQETILRTTAVEGVGYIAAKGGKAAFEALFEFLKQPSLSIRRAAVQAILSTPKGQEARKRIEGLLPKDQRFLLDIKPADVREVPQIKQPGRHLKDTGRKVKKVAPPTIPDTNKKHTKRRRPGPKVK